MNALMIFAGLALHFLMKYGEEKKKAKKENKDFIFFNWIKSESIYIISTIILSVLAVLTITIPDDIQNYSGMIINMTYIKYAGIGYAGASVIRNLISFGK